MLGPDFWDGILRFGEPNLQTSRRKVRRFEGSKVRRFKGLEVQRFGDSNLKLSEFWRMLVPHPRTHMSKSFGVEELQFGHEFNEV